MVEFEVKMTAGDLFDYMLRHAYNSPAGILSSGLAAVMIVAGVMKAQWLWIILGAFMLLYLPWSLWVQSSRQAKDNPAFSKPLRYVMDEEGVSVTQGDVTEKQNWGNLYRAVSTNKSIILYTGKKNACIFPKRDLKDKNMQVIQMICTHMDASKVKIRQ